MMPTLRLHKLEECLVDAVVERAWKRRREDSALCMDTEQNTEEGGFAGA